jgi:DNA-binding HxlR family transcriptional regulator
VIQRTYGQYCGVARALELAGERRTLLIVRDLLAGPRRFTDLRRGHCPTRIS